MDKIISATRFKAQCLALMNEVAQTGQTVVVTKRKRPIVRVTPAEPAESLRGTVRFLVSDEELIAPLPESWEADR